MQIERLRLGHQCVDFWVDLNLAQYRARWIAVAFLSGEPEIGLGYSRRQAVHTALLTLGPEVAGALAADKFEQW